MRNYIFAFEQERALNLDLKLNELLLLDYMLKFFQIDQIKRKRKDERFYCKLTYNKILNDLPILRIKERQLRNIIIGLENKGLIERLVELKNQMHLYVNWGLLFSTPPRGGQISTAFTFKSGTAVAHKKSQNQKSKLKSKNQLKKLKTLGFIRSLIFKIIQIKK